MKGKLIFIVDDDPFVTGLVRKRLSKEGYNVESYAYAEECIRALSKNPDLIVLDYYFLKEGSIPMNGMEAFEKIHLRRPDTPVIMLSGQEKGEVVLELARKGISDYVLKDNNLIESLSVSVKEAFERQ